MKFGKQKMAREQTEKFLRERQDKVLLSATDIQQRVTELGQQISGDYHGKCPILIGVLNGAFMFCADLFREITIDCEVDFIKISSYDAAMETSGAVKLLKNIDADLNGRDVLIVEDIVDSGYSVQFLGKKLDPLKPKSLRFVSLLVKEGALRAPVEIDYVGFKIPNHFVVGYGLDFAQKLRNLPHVYLMD